MPRQKGFKVASRSRMATCIHGWFSVRIAVLRCVCLLLRSRVCMSSFHRREKMITCSLRAPIKWQTYIHPSRLTFHFRPGSGAHGGGPVREAKIQGEIQRACSRRGDKDLERADLSGKPYDYEDSMRCVYRKQSIQEPCS